MVTIEKTGTDVCALTGKQGEGVYCKFTDGSFHGFSAVEEPPATAEPQAGAGAGEE